MPQSLSNFDAALKDNYGPGLRNALNNSNPIFTEVMVNDEDIIGRKAVWSVHTSRSSSTGARAELASLPTADRQRYTQVYDDLAFVYHTVKVSGQAKALTRNDTGSFVRALESEISGAEKDLKNDLARQAAGTGVTISSTVYSGALAASSGNSGAVVTLTRPEATSTALSASEMRYFFVGESVQVINGSTGAVRGTAAITAVTPATPSITLDATIAVTAGDFVVRAGNLGNEINGLRFLISPTSVYANIDPASVPNWAAVEVGSTSTPVSEVLFNQADEKVQTDGDGGSPNLFLVEHSQRRKLAQQLQVQKRYDGMATTLTAGWQGLQLANGTLVADRFIPVNHGFGLNTKEISRFVGLDFTWDDDDGKVLFKALDGSDAVEARFKAYFNLEATNRNSHVHILMSTPSF